MRAGLFALCALAGCQNGSVRKDAVIGSKPSCTACRIEAQKVLSITDTIGLMGWGGGVAVDSRGLFYVGATRDQTILVMDSSAKVLRRIGRSGKGPGEFLTVNRLGIASDTLFVSDMSGQAISLLTLDGTFIRRIPFGAMDNTSSFLPLRSNLIAYSADRFDGSLVRGVHLLDSSGAARHTIRTTYDSATGRYSAEGLLAAPTSRGTLWVAHERRYTIDERSLTGELLRTIRRSADWFQPLSDAKYEDPSIEALVTPLPRLLGAVEDDQGRLWTYSMVGNPDWQPPPLPKSREGPAFNKFAMSIDHDSMYDLMVEVIDIRTNKLLASQRFPDPMYGPNRHGLILRTLEPENGERVIEVWRFNLVQ
jgi:hypothetical protein